jgi:hypothetical protein
VARERWAWPGIALAAAGCTWVVLAMVGVLPMGSMNLGHYSAALATAAVAAFQLAGSLAGGGRPAPGARFAPALRVALAALTVRRFLGPAYAAATASFFALCALAPRLGGPGLASPATALAYGMNAALFWEAHHGDAVAYAYAVEEGLMIASLAAVAIAVRWLRLGSTRLAALGITPWSPSDLALIPYATRTAIGRMWLQGRSAVGLVSWIPVAVVPIEILALRYLDRRLREAEARAGAKAAAAAPAGAEADRGG